MVDIKQNMFQYQNSFKDKSLTSSSETYMNIQKCFRKRNQQMILNRNCTINDHMRVSQKSLFIHHTLSTGVFGLYQKESSDHRDNREQFCTGAKFLNYCIIV